MEVRLPIYKKRDKWRVVIFHKGTRHDFIVEGTKGEAEQFEARQRLDITGRDPSLTNRVAPTFSDFSKGPYRDHAERHLKKLTWTNRTYIIATLSDHFGTMKLSEIQTVTVEAYKNARLDDVGASTVNDELKILRTMLAYARELGFPVAQPKIKDIPTRGVKRKAKAWTAGQVASLLEAIRDTEPQLEPLVMFLLNTGCRKGEALALRWEHIDFEAGLIRIEPSEEWQPKDGEAREIPISDALWPHLLRPVASAYVFPSTDTGRYAYWPQRYFDRARTAAKLVGGPHTCRHTFATHFLLGRPDLFLLAKLLGHSHAHVTELYSHLLPDHLALARNVVNLGGAIETLPVTLPRNRERAAA